MIAKAPEIFGFGDVAPEQPFDYDMVEVRSGVKLKDAARCAGVDVEELRLLNSELIRDCTSAGEQSYQLRIPKGKTDIFLAEYSNLPPESFTISRDVEQRDATGHKVRKGDTLASVSRKYGITVTALMRSNHLKKTEQLKVGQRLVIPGDSGTENGAVADASPNERTVTKKSVKTAASGKTAKKGKKSGDAPDTITYVVKRMIIFRYRRPVRGESQRSHRME